MDANKPRLILASGSPRRQELLREYGYPFEVFVPDDNAECGICSRETPPELVARLAFQKANNVAVRIPTGLVLAADTVAECRGLVLGKPHDRQHAKEMLLRMQGTVHHVYSGVCLWSRPENKIVVRVDRTKLRMDSLSDAQIEAYLDTDQWIGKAGAFGFQDGLDWVHIIEGSESNVVGLPMELLGSMLSELER